MIFTPGQLNRRSEFYYQLGSTLGAGVPIIQAFEMAARHPGARGARTEIRTVIEHLKAGLSLGDSLERTPGWLPEFDVALLGAGETSGRLDTSFRLLSEYYASRAKIIRDTLVGLLVTVATFHVFLLVFPINDLTGFAQAILAGDYLRCVPYLARKLAIFGTFYGLIFLGIYACQGQRGEAWRTVLESVTDLAPLLRTARKYLALSRLCAALDATTNAGVNIVQAWSLATAAAGSPSLKRVVAGWKRHLETGATPAEMVARSGYFPEMFVTLYATGEKSGSLEEALRRMQQYYQEEGTRTLRLFTRVLNALIYGSVAVLTGWNIIRFWLNYYNNLTNTLDGV
ncbi:MAG: type II secretion system F family protein [Verrucomicrobiota bacterium]